MSAGAKQVIEACSQIVDCLVDRLLTLEEKVVGEKWIFTINNDLSISTTFYVYFIVIEFAKQVNNSKSFAWL